MRLVFRLAQVLVVLSMLGHQGLVRGGWLGLLNAQTVCVVYILVFRLALALVVLSMLGHQGLVQGSWLGLLNAQTVCVVYIVAVLQMTMKQELKTETMASNERKESRQTTMRTTPMPKG